MRYARPRTRRHGESPVGDLLPSASRPASTSSAGARPPPAPFGFRHAARHEKRPSPHTKCPLRGLHEKSQPNQSRLRRTRSLRGLHERNTGNGKLRIGAEADFVKFRAPRRRRFVSRRGEEARMGGGDAPTPARRSLKPGGGKSQPDRQRRSFAAPGFVVARSAANGHGRVSPCAKGKLFQIVVSNHQSTAHNVLSCTRRAKQRKDDRHCVLL